MKYLHFMRKFTKREVIPNNIKTWVIKTKLFAMCIIIN